MRKASPTKCYAFHSKYCQTWRTYLGHRRFAGGKPNHYYSITVSLRVGQESNSAAICQ